MAGQELDLSALAAFGVAGNFTGHLEQAGEAADFAGVKTAEAAAPKALFPTYLPPAPGASGGGTSATPVPSFLRVFPFDSRTIIFPPGEEKLQIEPECAVVFDVCWQDDQVLLLTPCCFGASNDCSIRKPRPVARPMDQPSAREDGTGGAHDGGEAAVVLKISEKKNWGPCSKGFSDHRVPLASFRAGCTLDGYRIASFLVRDGKAYPYGEDSPVAGYSYIWEKLTDWLVDRLNFQKDEGPAEDVHAYLAASGLPSRILVSIGATRYTDWGERNFLRDGDESVVVLYPGAAYGPGEILRRVESHELDDDAVSVLWQKVRA